MATITTRQLTDGSTRWRVEFRDGGRHGKKRAPSFSDHATAAAFKTLIDTLGNVWPDDATLIRKGFGMLIGAAKPGPIGADVTLVDYATAYLGTLECGPQTLRTYTAAVRDHLAPYFDGSHAPARLADIRRAHMRAWQKWMIEVKGRSAKTVCNTRGLLIPMFEAACDTGEYDEPAILTRTPMRKLKAPKKTPYSRAYLRTPEHAALLLSSARDLDPAFADLVWFLAATGARWGEATALHADACHLGAAPLPYVEVARVARRVTGEGWRIADGAKTEAGAWRQLRLYPDLAAMVARRAAQAGPGGLVFAAPDGGLWQRYGNYWRDRWAPIVAEARRRGLPYDLTIHGLRKTAVTAWVTGGADIAAVRDEAGHASAQTTLAVYTGDGGHAALVAAAEAFLGGAAAA